MAKAKVGDRVKVHFVGTLEDGTIFGSTAKEEPFEFTTGEQQVLPKFEEAVMGLKEGDTTTISIPPEDAYGHRKEDLAFTVEKSEIPSHIVPEVGKKVRVQLPDGSMSILTVVQTTEDKVTFDGNDPLAGRKLTFEITLLEILQDEKE